MYPGYCAETASPNALPVVTKAGPMIPQARAEPPRKDHEALRPVSMPTPMNAGVHSQTQFQLSTAMIHFQPRLYSVQLQCQSQSIPGAYSETHRRVIAAQKAIIKAFVFFFALASAFFPT